MLSGIYEPHPDVVSWFDRATTAGGTISGTAFDALRTAWCLRWELAGILSTIRIGLEMPFLGTNLAAALTPLYIPTGKTISSLTFVQGIGRKRLDWMLERSNNLKILGSWHHSFRSFYVYVWAVSLLFSQAAKRINRGG
jgi:hypothetical protein